ncbi:hypothetical protein CALCODRAFT_500410 [Calocera cornea HHB12733]|uniref:DNA endonuclease activator Ctp1 C-terminal domain-containing protein n=1 Tax=Calocera cornea HHB12733 TaxID=1353952 RepID=A0A165E2G5_9BASI|nr:hypothetical protein CALCODRAFT_500410 [Calocera cornea HHB12733]
MVGGSKAVSLTSSNGMIEKEKEIKELNRKNNYLRRQNDELLKAQFELENRVRWLTDRLGFATAEEAETQLADNDITLLELQSEYESAQARIHDLEEDAIVHAQAYGALRHEHELAQNRIQELEQDLKDQTWIKQDRQSGVESQVAELSLELHERDAVIAKLRAEVQPLRPRALTPSAGKENTPVRSSQSFVPSSPQPGAALATPTRKKNLPSPAEFLQAQLSDLQERYDGLLRIHRANVQQRSHEHKIWKQYKERVTEQTERLRKQSKRQVPRELSLDSPRKRRKMTEVCETTARRSNEAATSAVHARLRIAEVESQTQYEDEVVPASQDPDRRGSMAGVVKSQVLVPATSETDLEETQEQQHNRLSHRPPNSDSRVPSTSASRTTVKDEVPTPQSRKPLSDSALARRQMMYEADGDRTLVDLKGKGKAAVLPDDVRILVGSRTDSPVTTLPTDRNERAAVLHDLSRLPNDQYVDQYRSFKGRGRYQANMPKPGEEGINARFEIDKTKNHGVAYQYDSVVRNKLDRSKLHAADCECCRDWYEAVGPLPPRLQAPLWRSPSPRKRRRPNTKSLSPEASSHHNYDRVVAAGVRAHMQEVSRHREEWSRSSYPPGYMNIAFPTTQEALAINEKAAEIHREKDRKIEIDAERGGKYKRKRS